jgi:hypothetical protein
MKIPVDPRDTLEILFTTHYSRIQIVNTSPFQWSHLDKSSRLLMMLFYLWRQYSVEEFLELSSRDYSDPEFLQSIPLLQLCRLLCGCVCSRHFLTSLRPLTKVFQSHPCRLIDLLLDRNQIFFLISQTLRPFLCSCCLKSVNHTAFALIGANKTKQNTNKQKKNNIQPSFLPAHYVLCAKSATFVFGKNDMGSLGIKDTVVRSPQHIPGFDGTCMKHTAVSHSNGLFVTCEFQIFIETNHGTPTLTVSLSQAMARLTSLEFTLVLVASSLQQQRKLYEPQL